MARHTRGPWVVRDGYSAVFVDAGKKVVAAVGEAPYFEPHTEEDEANARLIAAAPELLAILEGVRCYVVDTANGRAVFDGDDLSEMGREDLVTIDTLLARIAANPAAKQAAA